MRISDIGRRAAEVHLMASYLPITIVIACAAYLIWSGVQHLKSKHSRHGK